jgi:hypothetical protein
MEQELEVGVEVTINALLVGLIRERLNLGPIRCSLGDIVATPAFMHTLPLRDYYHHIVECVARHEAGQWGELEREDAETNDQTLKQQNGGMVMSCWRADPKDETSTEWWIITTGVGLEDSYTTLLLPSDY